MICEQQVVPNVCVSQSGSTPLAVKLKKKPQTLHIVIN